MIFLYQTRLAFEKAYLDPNDFLDVDSVPESVAQMSMQIVGDETEDYKKLYLLHKWVAENIYYDFDYYYSGGTLYSSSEDVLEHRRTVCAGYAALLHDLILAQGIPVIESTTYALGLSTLPLSGV